MVYPGHLLLLRGPGFSVCARRGACVIPIKSLATESLMGVGVDSTSPVSSQFVPGDIKCIPCESVGRELIFLFTLEIF